MIYVIKSRYVQENVSCDACDSTGNVTIKNVEYMCPRCHSRKGGGHTEHFVVQVQIYKIMVVLQTNAEPHISYNYIYDYDELTSSDVYTTEEAARLECEKRNKRK